MKTPTRRPYAYSATSNKRESTMKRILITLLTLATGMFIGATLMLHYVHTHPELQHHETRTSK